MRTNTHKKKWRTKMKTRFLFVVIAGFFIVGCGVQPTVTPAPIPTVAAVVTEVSEITPAVVTEMPKSTPVMIEPVTIMETAELMVEAKVLPQLPIRCQGEMVVAPFSEGLEGVTTSYLYSGTISVTVAGYGQTPGQAYVDAFYIFADEDGFIVDPVHPEWEGEDFTLAVNEVCVDDLVTIPPYSQSHIYSFPLEFQETDRLTFGVSDRFVSDNTGQFTICVEGEAVVPHYGYWWEGQPLFIQVVQSGSEPIFDKVTVAQPVTKTLSYPQGWRPGKDITKEALQYFQDKAVEVVAEYLRNVPRLPPSGVRPQTFEQRFRRTIGASGGDH